MGGEHTAPERRGHVGQQAEAAAKGRQNWAEVQAAAKEGDFVAQARVEAAEAKRTATRERNKAKHGGRRLRYPTDKKRPMVAQYVNLRERLENVIEEALGFPLPSGRSFVECVAAAAEQRPLEALRAFAAYLPVQVQAEIRTMSELHLVAVRELARAPLIEGTVVGTVVGSAGGKP